jgi:AbiU2
MSAQPTPEQIFLERLGALERDARAAARYAYVGSAINFIANQQPGLIPVLDRDAGFWNTVLGAMQTASIVGLGRIYDSRRDVLSAKRLVDHVITYPGIFSRTALAARKSAEYASDRFEPTEADLIPLRAALVEHTALYDATVGPIRDKVFAHAGNITRAEMYELFQNVPRAKYEKLSIFPLDLFDTLFQLYYNGEPPDIRTVESDLATLVANPPGEREITTEPRYAIKETVQFLEHLIGVPIPPTRS